MGQEGWALEGLVAGRETAATDEASYPQDWYASAIEAPELLADDIVEFVEGIDS